MTKTFLKQIPLRAAAVAVALSALGVTSAHAGNAGASLGDCYNHVISACNQTAHPVPCSEAGMDACDEHHAANGANGALERIRILVGRGDTPSYRAIIETDRPAPQRPTGDDGRDEPNDEGTGQGASVAGSFQPSQPQQQGQAAQAE